MDISKLSAKKVEIATLTGEWKDGHQSSRTKGSGIVDQKKKKKNHEEEEVKAEHEKEEKERKGKDK